MMDVLQKILLGIVQGLTEFLPISSSGHLEIVKYLLKDPSAGEQSLMTTVVLHFATALSTVVVFYQDIYRLVRGSWARPWTESHRYLIFIVLSMIPAALVGVFLENKIEQIFSQNLVLVGLCLIGTATLLWLTDFRKRELSRGLSPLPVFIIGLAQAIAILPGISRSGATIAMAILLKINREEAARFSFLMVVPLIFGKMFLDLMDGEFSLYTDNNLWSLLAGFLAAFFTGIVACRFMVRIVRESKLIYFALYCLVVGMLVLLTGIYRG